MRFLVPTCFFVVACAAPAPAPASAQTAKPTARDLIAAEAGRLEGFAESPLAHRYLDAARALPHVAPRVLHRTKDKSRYLDAAAYARESDESRKELEELRIDEEGYYETKYGSPLSYVRALDVLASRGVGVGQGTRLLDFGYGYVGHLRILAMLGVDATGVDVDPMLPALYSSPGDQGEVRHGSAIGHIRLIDGHFPSDPSVVAAVGKSYDVIISKNVLKRGYIHPDRPANPKQLIALGLPDDAVLERFHDALRPGGVFLVYNICPALSPPDRPFIPWSDGRSPFTREAYADAGFEVLAFDRDDREAVTRMARLLGWGDDPESPWDVEHDLSVLYTLVRRR